MGLPALTHEARAHSHATSPGGCRIHPESTAARPAKSFVFRRTRLAPAGRLPRGCGTFFEREVDLLQAAPDRIDVDVNTAAAAK